MTDDQHSEIADPICCRGACSGTNMPPVPFLWRGMTSAEEISMGIEQAPTEKGKEAARGVKSLPMATPFRVQ